MITLATTFKPFVGHDAIRQRNALSSWLHAASDIEVFVFGWSAGVETIVREFNLVYRPDVPMFENRLVRIDAIFDIVQKEGTYDVQIYVNGDMILTPEFFLTLKSLHFKRFLAVGRRWTLPVNELIDFDNSVIYSSLVWKARASGKQDGSSAMDYFGYRKGTLHNLPPMYVGTVLWDNYMVKHCLQHGFRVVDMSEHTVVHQEHDYEYLKGGLTEFTAGNPAQINRKLYGENSIICSTLDASHIQTHGAVVPARGSEYVSRRMERLRVFHPLMFKMLGSWKLRSLICRLFVRV